MGVVFIGEFKLKKIGVVEVLMILEKLRLGKKINVESRSRALMVAEKAVRLVADSIESLQ